MRNLKTITLKVTNYESDILINYNRIETKLLDYKISMINYFNDKHNTVTKIKLNRETLEYTLEYSGEVI